jgi:hypothetical protein
MRNAGLICSALSDNRITHELPWLPGRSPATRRWRERQTLISSGICTSPGHMDWLDRSRRPTQTGSDDAHLPSSPKCARNHASLGEQATQAVTPPLLGPTASAPAHHEGQHTTAKWLSSPQIPQTNHPTGRCLAIISWPNSNVACSGARPRPPIRRPPLDLAA